MVGEEGHAADVFTIAGAECGEAVEEAEQEEEGEREEDGGHAGVWDGSWSGLQQRSPLGRGPRQMEDITQVLGRMVYEGGSICSR